MSTASQPVLKPGRMVLGLFFIVLFLALLVYQEDQIIRKTLALGRPHLAWRLWFPMMLLGLGLLVPKPRRWPLLGGVGLIANLVLLADTVYGRYFGLPPSFQSSAALGQVGHTVASIASLLQVKDIAPLFLWSVFWVPPIKDRAGLYASRQPALICLVLAAGLLGFATTRTYDGVTALRQPGRQFSRAFTVRYTGLFSYHWIDLIGVLGQSKPRPLNGDQRDQLTRLLEERKRRNQKSDPLFGVAAGRNVILIQMEAWQHFLIGLEVEGAPVTPYLNELASSGLAFDHIMDVTAVGRTSDAEFAALTGGYPSGEKISGMAYARNHLTGLPSLLREEGYQTWSFHGFQAYFWNRSELHPALGIQNMQFQNTFPKGVLGWGVPDDVFFDQSAQRLRTADTPFFALLISLSCHHPFNALPKSGPPFTIEGAPEASGYLKLAHFADRGLGLFLQHLKTSGLDQNSVIVLYGDHDAGLDRHNLSALSELTGKDLSTPAEDRVPFIILAPGLEQALRQVNQAGVVRGGLQDLLPTLTHLLGLETPPGIWGVNLMSSNRADLIQPVPVHRGYWWEDRFQQLDVGADPRAKQAQSIIRLNQLMLDTDFHLPVRDRESLATP